MASCHVEVNVTSPSGRYCARWTAGPDGYCSPMVKGGTSLFRVSTLLGCPCSMRARSALWSLSEVQCDLGEIAVGLEEPQLHNRAICRPLRRRFVF